MGLRFTLLLLQVTFVFTNQVGGKLIPVESVSPKVQGAERNENGFRSKKQNMNQKSIFSQHQKPIQSVLSDGDSVSTFSKPLSRATMKSVRTNLKVSTDVVKTKLSPGDQLPQKRLSPDTVEHDDDFE